MEIALAIATLLGGLTAVWFLVDKARATKRKGDLSSIDKLSPSEAIPLTTQSDRFVRLQTLMPDLLTEMRTDLLEKPSRREIVLLKKSWSYGSRGDELFYYYDDHPELQNKFHILENEGLAREITYNNVSRFIISEELVDYLTKT